MELTLTNALLAIETDQYRGTGGVSENNHRFGFQAAFIDRETGTVHLSRFTDGRLAPCHLLNGLPPEIVLARDGRGRVRHVKASLQSGFVHGGRFYTRDEAAAMLASAPVDLAQSLDTPLRRAA